MIIKVKVKTGASLNLVTKSQFPGIDFDVKTTAIREKGKANHEVIRLLSEYLQISPSQITIKSGIKSNLKTIVIDE